MSTAMVMCLTEVPVSGIRLLSRIITHPVDNTLSPKERNENRAVGGKEGATRPSVLWLWTAIRRWKLTVTFHISECSRILLALLHNWKNICKCRFLWDARCAILRLHAMIRLGCPDVKKQLQPWWNSGILYLCTLHSPHSKLIRVQYIFS